MEENEMKLIGSVLRKNGKKVIVAETLEDNNGKRIFDTYDFDIDEKFHKESIEKFNIIDSGLEKFSKASGKSRKEVNEEFMKNFNEILRNSDKKEFGTFEEFKNTFTFL